MNGIILINKPANMTSHDVVFKVRKILKTKKVGHCGTLDPLAKGLLVVCVNKATKVLPFLTSEKKEYTAKLLLGKHTDTYDLEGKVLKEAPIPNLTKEKVEAVLQSFLGDSKQVPPIYSAIKVNGKKLYEYAREGIEVEIEPRDIHIEKIELLDLHENEITFSCVCSKGTYIRSLCVDIANKLGTVGVMSDLFRDQSGHFKIADSCTLEQLQEGNYKLISIEEALQEYPQVVVEDENIVYHGKQIKSSKKGLVKVVNKEGKVLAMYEQNGHGYLKNVRGLW